MRDNYKDREKIPQETKDLVITRIDVQAPSNLRLSIGSYKSLTKEEMIEHVRKGDEIGRHIIRSHLAFIRAVMSGEVAQALASIKNE